MKQKLPHLYLRNPFGSVAQFDKSRNMGDPKIELKDPEAYRRHKQKLDRSFAHLIHDKISRLQRKTIISQNIEIVEVRFLIPFSDGVKYKTRTRFVNEFGLSPVLERDLNRTVLFAITDEAKFAEFDRLLNQYIQSDNQISPRGTPYAIMTALYDVKYHTSDDIRNNCKNDLVFGFINNNQDIHIEYDAQRELLESHLTSLVVSGLIDSFAMDPYDKMVQIKGASREVVIELTNNFDILAKAHSLRRASVKPDQFNAARLTWDLRISRNNANGMIVGVLDNGVRPIDPIRETVAGGLDLTAGNDPLTASHPHGTIVASLASVGERYFSGENELAADTQIYSIKILENINGYIDVIKIVEAIRETHLRSGIRLFNLSVCAQGKGYNEAPSLFAYLLDKLAYELDILIFIAAGNMNYDDLETMQEVAHDLHTYPKHFYSPGESSDIHSCEFTNICIPAESMNHISVGALADNFRPESSTDLSLDKDLPAYYTRKNHYDFKQVINGATVSSNHGNKNLFKPDIVMPGGDLLHKDSGMQVLGFGEAGNDFYAFDAGTSLAAPLALNLAVQLLNLYPGLSPQSVKALLLNSADNNSSIYWRDIVRSRKERISQKEHGSAFEDLSGKDKKKITNQLLSAVDIHRNLVGCGKPDRERLLYSTDRDVSLLIEDSIPTNHHKVVLVGIPEYVLDSTTSQCLKLEATLCFKVNPAWGSHVDYNPLHISFNFANSVIKNSLDELADVISDRNHQFYRESWTDEIHDLQRRKQHGGLSEDEKEKLSKLKGTVRKKTLGVKNLLASWSEDFFPLVNKPLSNRQQMTIILNKKDIRKIGNKLVVVLRCAVKENLDPELQAWAQRTPAHAFSLAIRVVDKSKIEEERSLYDELQAVNNIEIIPNTILDLDLDLEAEA